MFWLVAPCHIFILQHIFRKRSFFCNGVKMKTQMSGYDYVPEPVPVKSSIEISAFYYPGTEQMAEWDQVDQVMPHIKPLLGWYDESNPEVVDWQIKWAVEHGISSFCVDWYWNRGDQRLDHWVKAFYKAKYRKYLKWYMMYANHNNVGSHSTEDQIKLTQFWIDNYFMTPEYYKTEDGRPVVVLWSWDMIDKDFVNEAKERGEVLQPGEGVKRALKLSDDMAKAAGLPGICFVDIYKSRTYEQWLVDRARNAGYEAQSVYNFDAGAYFIAEDCRKPDDTPASFSYDLVIEASKRWWNMTSLDKSFPLWPILPTGWNDKPRSFQNARVVHGRTPEKFREICRNCKDFCEKNGFKKIITAPLNEWQEGSYIEPNQEFGFGMYDAIRDVFCDKPEGGFPPNVTPAELGLGPYDYPPMVRPATTEWDFSENVQGWYRNPFGTAYLRIIDKALHFFKSHPDKAALRIRLTPFAAEDFSHFKIFMRVTPNPDSPTKPSGNEKMTLLWGTTDIPLIKPDITLEEESSVSIPVTLDGEWHEYALDVTGNPNWKGQVNEVWFDPVNLTQCYVDIKWMAFR